MSSTVKVETLHVPQHVHTCIIISVQKNFLLEMHASLFTCI